MTEEETKTPTEQETIAAVHAIRNLIGDAGAHCLPLAQRSPQLVRETCRYFIAEAAVIMCAAISKVPGATEIPSAAIVEMVDGLLDEMTVRVCQRSGLMQPSGAA